MIPRLSFPALLEWPLHSSSAWHGARAISLWDSLFLLLRPAPSPKTTSAGRPHRSFSSARRTCVARRACPSIQIRTIVGSAVGRVLRRRLVPAANARPCATASRRVAPTGARKSQRTRSTAEGAVMLACRGRRAKAGSASPRVRRRCGRAMTNASMSRSTRRTVARVDSSAVSTRLARRGSASRYALVR